MDYALYYSSKVLCSCDTRTCDTRTCRHVHVKGLGTRRVAAHDESQEAFEDIGYFTKISDKSFGAIAISRLHASLVEKKPSLFLSCIFVHRELVMMPELLHFQQKPHD